MDLKKFNKIFTDFIDDINLVFPEYEIFNKKIYNDFKSTSDDIKEKALNELYDYCKKKFPKHFFDILYKNEKIFETEEYFIPEISFKSIWEIETSEDTKTKIWQYLQLILMCITENMEDTNDFGDATQLFDLLDDNEFKEKLAETFEELTNRFDQDISGIDLDKEMEDISFNENYIKDTFDPEKIHEHLSKLLEGKIGCLAKEIAGDTLNDLGIDASNGNTQEIFQTLIKDPSKLMLLMKKIGDKIENKIKKGEINKDELMSEASELFKNMKDMPGFEDMFNKMAKSHMGRKGGKVPSMNSMESMLEKNMKASKQRKKMLERLQEKQQREMSVNDKKTEDKEEKKEVVYTDEEILKSFMVEDVKKPNVTTKKKKKKKK